MKIGVITHHYVKNYGAFLQSKGLIEVLKELYPDAKVEIVDYVYRKHWIKNIAHVLHFHKGTDTWKTYGNQIKRLIMFSRYEHTLPRSSKVYQAEDIKRLQYDLLVLGSDEIWDYRGRGYRPLKFGAGMKNAAGRMIAYAPSCGRVNGSDTLPETLESGLKNFDAISVRDFETQDMIRQISVSAPVLLDPTFLYDFEADLIREKVQVKMCRYILVYDCKLTEQQVKVLSDYAKHRKLKIAGGGDYQTYYTEDTDCLTPYEWIALFKNADIVVTGTFHGTVFSIKYRKKFISFPTEKNRIQKIGSLLKMFHLEERLLTDASGEALQALLETAVDYSEPDKIQNDLYKKSMDFLRTYGVEAEVKDL